MSLPSVHGLLIGGLRIFFSFQIQYIIIIIMYVIYKNVCGLQLCGLATDRNQLELPYLPLFFVEERESRNCK